MLCKCNGKRYNCHLMLELCAVYLYLHFKLIKLLLIYTYIIYVCVMWIYYRVLKWKSLTKLYFSYSFTCLCTSFLAHRVTEPSVLFAAGHFWNDYGFAAKMYRWAPVWFPYHPWIERGYPPSQSCAVSGSQADAMSSVGLTGPTVSLPHTVWSWLAQENIPFCDWWGEGGREARGGQVQEAESYTCSRGCLDPDSGYVVSSDLCSRWDPRSIRCRLEPPLR